MHNLTLITVSRNLSNRNVVIGIIFLMHACLVEDIFPNYLISQMFQYVKNK